MKRGWLCLLFLSACSYLDPPYDYSLSWECLSSEGCERADVVVLIDRFFAFPSGTLTFESSKDPVLYESAQRAPSEDAPPDCQMLYGLTLFGQELTPFPICEVRNGFDMEIHIPNVGTATVSRWQVEARAL